MCLGLFEIKGRVAVVVGGGGGLGQAISLGLARSGADVVPVDLSLESTASVTEAIEGLGRRTLHTTVNATDECSTTEFVKRTLNELGRIDILVNCAGLTIKKPLLDLGTAEWDSVQECNLKAVFVMDTAVARVMKAQGRGRIINMASMGSFVGIRTSAAYCAAKGGVLQLTKVMAQEWAPYGIRVNAIAPGFFNTRLFQGIRRNPEAYKKVLERIPIGRVGEPSELVGTVIYLASDASEYVTGVCIPVDGGFLADGV